jgi:hypothetical protein
MTQPTSYRRYGEGYVPNVLRREIMAARLKVTLDEELGRRTSETAKRLAVRGRLSAGMPVQRPCSAFSL